MILKHYRNETNYGIGHGEKFEEENKKQKRKSRIKVARMDIYAAMQISKTHSCLFWQLHWKLHGPKWATNHVE